MPTRDSDPDRTPTPRSGDDPGADARAAAAADAAARAAREPSPPPGRDVPPRSPRSRPHYGAHETSNRPSPIALGAIAVVLAGAALLFWQRTGPVPTGVGEQSTLVTAPHDSAEPGGTLPHSGEVDIAQQGLTLTPERPQGRPAERPEPPPKQAAAASRPGSTLPPTDPVAERPATADESGTPAGQTTEVAQQSGRETVAGTTDTTPAPTEPAPRRTEPAKPAGPVAPQPRATGAYAVQVASFSEAANARDLQNRLTARGHPAMIRPSRTADGRAVHRVWIGYFQDRAEAQAYIDAYVSTLGDAIPVTR